ncbi:hypothetical protein [Serratia marcescens]|uniref:hypothetical protein n=1 Tax=Serratia marcescens TaxID=615 RepID=UPI0034D59CF4
MNPSSFWKNFRLGEELQISGTFIYNGLRRFHELRTFDFDDELFEFLYELSVGFERLLKVAVVLYEHTDTMDQLELEKSLITHNHLQLVARLRKHVNLKLGTSHNELLNILSIFYKSMRYDRFTLTSIYENDQEAKTMICGFLVKYLEADFSNESMFLGTGNDEQYRKFIRQTVLKVTREIYSVIKDRARRINLYTYELRSGSKAESVFLREVDVADEDILWKELLVFFMNVKADTGYLQFLKETLPLGFDSALIPDYLNCFKSDSSKADVMDELEQLYSEMGRDERNERLQRIGIIGDPSVFFDDEIDDSDQWEDIKL